MKNTIFGKRVHLISCREVKKIADSHNGDKYIKAMNSRQQLMVLLHAQLAARSFQ